MLLAVRRMNTNMYVLCEQHPNELIPLLTICTRNKCTSNLLKGSVAAGGNKMFNFNVIY